MDDPPAFHRGPADAHVELSYQMEQGSFLNQASLRNVFARVQNLEAVVSELLGALAANDTIRAEQVPLAIKAYGQRVDDTTDVAAEARDAGLSTGASMEPATDGALGARWPGVVLRSETYDIPQGEPVDCAARMSVCHAVCCSLSFPLSASEVEGEKVKWDMGHPYMIRHDTSGYCTHNDAETGGCQVYEDRPAVCRRYSCAADPRIWKDFEGMVLNHEWIADHFANPGRVRMAVRPAGSDNTP
jgi:Fe-S-cluster containining protein